MDYSVFYKRCYDSLAELSLSGDYDFLISCYNDSERVKSVFSKISAIEKCWIILPEYNYSLIEHPVLNQNEYKFESVSFEENIVFRDFFELYKTKILNKKVCIDITGLLRPHIVFLVRYLKEYYPQKIDFIYSTPDSYVKKEETDFSSDYIEVRQVKGCEGSHNSDTSNDLLIISAGYDNVRISDVGKNKASARKVLLIGFPAVQPDMFQENILKVYNSEEESRTSGTAFLDKYNSILAPANDPFITANNLKLFIGKTQKEEAITNLYLCPLSTKAQTLGLAYYYVNELINSNSSIIFPFCKTYSKETSVGISKIWIYTLEFDISV